MDRAIAEQIAKEKMLEHGLNDWTFSFDDSVRRFGCCQHGIKRITLSEKLVELNSEEAVMQTILHEIAHALAGPFEGHNETWQSVAIKLGHSGKRCYSNDVLKPSYRFIGVCPNCKKEKHAYKRTKIACGKCCKEFNNGLWTSKFTIKWERINND